MGVHSAGGKRASLGGASSLIQSHFTYSPIATKMALVTHWPYARKRMFIMTNVGLCGDDRPPGLYGGGMPSNAILMML